MKTLCHDYKKIIREYDQMIKEMDRKLKEKRREFDEEIRNLRDVPNSHQISRIVDMVNDMRLLKEDIKKFWSYRLRDLKRWVENLRDRR